MKNPEYLEHPPKWSEEKRRTYTASFSAWMLSASVSMLTGILFILFLPLNAPRLLNQELKLYSNSMLLIH